MLNTLVSPGLVGPLGAFSISAPGRDTQLNNGFKLPAPSFSGAALDNCYTAPKKFNDAFKNEDSVKLSLDTIKK